MIAGKYVEARDYAKSKGAAGAGYGEMLRSGERLAAKMAGESAAVIEGARTQLGKKVDLKLTNDTQKGTLKTVTDAGLTVATTYLINNQEHERDDRPEMGGTRMPTSGKPSHGLAGWRSSPQKKRLYPSTLPWVRVT